MSAHDAPLFVCFIETAIPENGLVVALSHVYVDESGTHDGAQVMGLAGYVFDAKQAARFSRDWSKCLHSIGIPFAHMTDCATGNGVYRGLSLEQRIDSEKLLIQHIKRRTKVGIAVLIDPNVYSEFRAADPRLPSAYSFCMMAFVSAVTKWSEKAGLGGKFSFFFEAGHRYQAEANAFMADIPKSKGPSRESYLSHTFFDKLEAPPLQAADMLAWQACHFFERKAKGHAVARKDFAALVRPHDYFNFYQRDDLEKMRPLLEAASGEVPPGASL